MRDRRHLHRHVVGFERDIAVALAERRLGLELFGIDQTLDDDLGVGGNVEVDGLAFDHRHWPSGEPAGHAELVEIDVELLRAGEQHHRRGADQDRDRHRLLALVVFLPMQIAARAAGTRHHAHHHPVRRLQSGAIGAAVLDAEVRVLGDAERGAEIRRGVEAGRRDRNREDFQAAIGFAQIVAGDDDLLAARGIGLDRRDRMRDRVHPALADILDRSAHAERIDFGRGRNRAHDHRHVVLSAGGVHDIGEEEGAAFCFGNAADELQPDQRMQLGVLVDRMIDPRQQPPRLEIREVLLEIKPRLRGFAAPHLCCHIVHSRPILPSRWPSLARSDQFAE